MSFTAILEPVSADQAYSPERIDMLAAAALRCRGLVLHRDKNTFKTHGGHEVPGEFKNLAELRAATRCVIGLSPELLRDDYSRYEIGIIESRKFPGMLVPAYDRFGGAIEKYAGPGLEKLNMYYQMEVARYEAAVRGYQYQEQEVGPGQYNVRVDMTAALGV